MLAMSGCASSGGKAAKDAASAPLNDLNLLNDEIPSVLLAARQAPYALPADTDCAALAASIAELDEALGPDIDARIEHGDGNALGEAANDALLRTAEGVVPFRSWVRKLSGAERHAKKVASAVAAGSMRRAFLKGVAATQGCGLAATEPAPPQ
ncbi:hypothetical protein CSC70_01160 [Pseudoxanthomonas kalamensis DSM 18571]|nr:hypothetical protein CSC70_01160 [Pseudoxanthomonas kalamensis DSM 18571]